MATVYKNAGIEAAKIAGESSEMDAVAQRVAGLARTAAAEHNASGAFVAGIRVRKVRGKRGVLDRIVENTDPLSAIKEFGHVIRNEDGVETGYVPGQHSMQKAVKRMPEVTGD